MIRQGTIVFLFIALTSFSALAEKMDQETHTLLIQKLERVLETGDSKDESKIPVTMRLADLYAERARMAAMDELAKNINNGPASASDRKRALELYKTAFEKVAASDKGMVLIQMAHLNELMGQTSQAVEIYNRVKKNSSQFPPDAVGIAHVGLGEVHFKKGQYKQALAEYEKALSLQQTPNRGQIMYRTAWCLFNLRKVTEATNTLISVLKTPRYLTRSSTEGSAVDTGFQTDASRDLATFLSRGRVGAREIQLVLSLSPQDSGLDNLVYLADELDRLGKKSDSYKIWSAVIERRSSTLDRLDGHIRLALLQYDMGQRELAAEELEKAIQYWKENGCNDEERCETMQSKMRKLVTDWAKLQEDNPTPALLKAYATYNSLFEDVEMTYWAAQTARQLKQFPQSAKFFRRASELASQRRKSGQGSGGDSKNEKIFEGSLLGEIEVAEMAKDTLLKDDAYNHYLNLNPDGPKSLEVRYQKAQIFYEKGDFEDSAKRFREVALSTKSSDQELKAKAANLALDSLVLAKRDDLIEGWASEFASKLPFRRLDYLKIARRAILNRTAAVLNSKDSSEREISTSLDDLNRLSLDGAPLSEKISVNKNRLIAAERLQRIEDTKRAADQLLAIKGLSAEDKEFALSRKAWAAEMLLDFKAALQITVKLNMNGVSRAERLLKLAQLSELAGQNPAKIYREFLSATGDNQKAQFVMARLIRLSSSPLKTFREFQNQLRTNSELFTSLALDVYARTSDLKFAESVLETRGAKNTTSGRVLNRFVIARDLKQIAQLVQKHRINASNDRRLKQTMNERLNLLKKLENFAHVSTEIQDWTIQILAFTAVARENARLANDILRLPVPYQLKNAQRKQFKILLGQQAAPFSQKAALINSKIRDLWNQSDVLEELGQDYKTVRGPSRKVIGEELRLLIAVAPQREKSQLVRLLSESGSSVNSQSIAAARASVKENPFSSRPLVRLKELEERAGRESWVAYLNTRIDKLENSGDEK
jgi:tetratricopeptide (TPR) repeat protein